MDLIFKWTVGIIFFSLSCGLNAAQSYYCPQKHGYINVGMTTDQVISACGKPDMQQEAGIPVLQKVPVQQIIFNNKGSGDVVYATYSLHTGSKGSLLEIDVVDNQVKAIKVNNSNSNVASFCDGAAIEIGDDVGKVYSSCGTPSIVNDTFIEMRIPKKDKPMVWVYQPGEFQPSVSLTFVNGLLQSIN